MAAPGIGGCSGLTPVSAELSQPLYFPGVTPFQVLRGHLFSLQT